MRPGHLDDRVTAPSRGVELIVDDQHNGGERARERVFHIGGEPLTLQAVRAVITEPPDGQTLESGSIVVRGLAWSGAAPIARVEVSIGPRPWEPATLTGPGHPSGWQSWELRARLERPGTVIVWARATDPAGRTQPSQLVWNPSGYAANAVHRIQVSVRPAALPDPGPTAAGRVRQQHRAASTTSTPSGASRRVTESACGVRIQTDVPLTESR